MHCDPPNLRYSFLKHKAIRICITPEVAQAVRDTKQANGPVLVIAQGIDPAPLYAVGQLQKTMDLLISAVKAPELGVVLYERLKGLGRVELLRESLPRDQFLRRLAEAQTCLLLPFADEGFYLPAAEAMGLGTLVVCPDCVGNRSFCLPGHNCVRPPYATDAIEQAAREAMQMSSEQRRRVLASARDTFNRHSLLAERESFVKLLLEINQLW